MSKNLWNRNELILAFNLYCKIPFSKINKSNQSIIELANAINRTPSSVAWKLVNFASLDPKITEKGLNGAKNVSKMDIAIFNEFNNNWNELSIESEVLYDKVVNKVPSPTFELKDGLEKEVVAKVRINQGFFRNAILSSYNNQCCITGLNKPELLIASHIVPWSKDEANRTNPHNGLCLNALHDKAFDKGLIGIDKNYKIKVSAKISEHIPNQAIEDNFVKYIEKEIILPEKFLPSVEFLEWHLLNIYLK